MPEMNGHWNEYCAFNRDGSSRGPRYSTAAFREAFARIALLSRGGGRGKLTQLRKLGLPGVRGDLPLTKARIVWNPQGYGNPTRRPTRRRPTTRATRMSTSSRTTSTTRARAAWDANEALSAAHPNKPFAIAEWGLWGIDDPAFVERMAASRGPTAHRVPLVLQREAGLALGSREQAAQPRRVSALITPLAG